jgi:hypothetical protein
MARQVDFSEPENQIKNRNNLLAMTAEGQIDGLIYATVTINPASLSDGDGATTSVSVPGAELGNFVLVAAPYDLQDMTVTAYVQASATVEVRIQNETGGAKDLASGSWGILVFSVA